MPAHRAFSLLLATALIFAAAVASLSPARADIGSYIVVDQRTGAVLADGDPFQPWYPASITKLMTAYVTFRAIRAGRLTLQSPVTMTANAAGQSPSKMGFRPGTVVTVDNALKMVIVKSANDMAMALGETVGGSESAFVAEMNREAARLGMTRTRFQNPNGLPDDAQVTTARDMAVLASAILNEFPEHRGLFSITGLKLGGSVIRTHNRFVERFQGGDGMKTGFICNAGFNVVATATRGGRTLIAVVLGAYSARERDEFAARLMTESFRRRASSPTLATFRNPPGLPAPLSRKAAVCGGQRPAPGEGQVLTSLTNPNAVELSWVAAPPQPKKKKGEKAAAAPAQPTFLETTARYSRPLVPVFIGLSPDAPQATAVAAGGDDDDDGPAVAAPALTTQQKASPAASAAAKAARAALGRAPAGDGAGQAAAVVGQAIAAEAPAARSIASAAEPGVSVPLNLLPPSMLNPAPAP